MYRFPSLALAAAAGLLLASPACAGTVLFQGVGLFSATAPTTAHSLANAGFAFSFDLDDPGEAMGATDFSTLLKDFKFTLNGVDDSAGFDHVDFTTDGFIFTFDGMALQLVGADLLDDRGVFDAPASNIYSVFVVTPSKGPVPSFVAARAVSSRTTSTLSGDATVVTTRPAGAVPEPATWGLMITGFGAAGAMVRRRRRLVLA